MGARSKENLMYQITKDFHMESSLFPTRVGQATTRIEPGGELETLNKGPKQDIYFVTLITLKTPPQGSKLRPSGPVKGLSARQ